MTYVLTVAKTAIDVPVIGGDLYPEDESAESYMFSALLGSPFVVDVTLSLNDVEVGGESGDIITPVPIDTAVAAVPGYTGVTFQVMDTDPYAYRIRVSGIPSVDFPATYSFVLDQPDPTLPFPTLDNVSVTNEIPANFFAVYSWVPPPNPSWEFLENVYNFTVNDGDISEATTMLNQYVYWNQESARTAFKNLVNSGDA